MVVLHAGQRVDRVEPVRDQRCDDRLGGGHSAVMAALCAGTPGPRKDRRCRKLDKTPPACASPAPKSGALPAPKTGAISREIRTPPCIAIAPTPAARCATATSARPCVCPAGAIASATMAACCSSTCATTTASRRCVADPDSPAFKDGREAARRMGGAGRRQGAPPPRRHRECRPADRRGRGLSSSEIEVLGPAGRAADAGVRRSGIPGRDPAQVPLPRPAPRAPAPQHHQARADHRFDPPAHEGAAASSSSRRRS